MTVYNDFLMTKPIAVFVILQTEWGLNTPGDPFTV